MFIYECISYGDIAFAVILKTCFLITEQYEAFLKFNHDQIQRRFSGESVASCKYLAFENSCIFRTFRFPNAEATQYITHLVYIPVSV